MVLRFLIDPLATVFSMKFQTIRVPLMP